ncbi:uncharacterized protein EI97DRAFT_134659 [Westerdykella ornata]|uniref:Uncharacterized protein n=1 Tax=Westerdykella ornata TaxID=318751 RepID=A0A6A6JCU9_WESOR|nr:uncharacterized protein EI97DRAFT_134659 [Westerdykella ornata]KAF2274054.1 hypothetical protein EI97DRAFT_134659 [Westerdykella ornata]
MRVCKKIKWRQPKYPHISLYIAECTSTAVLLRRLGTHVPRRGNSAYLDRGFSVSSDPRPFGRTVLMHTPDILDAANPVFVIWLTC